MTQFNHGFIASNHSGMGGGDSPQREDGCSFGLTCLLATLFHRLAKLACSLVLTCGRLLGHAIPVPLFQAPLERLIALCLLKATVIVCDAGASSLRGSGRRRVCVVCVVCAKAGEVYTRRYTRVRVQNSRHAHPNTRMHMHAYIFSCDCIPITQAFVRLAVFPRHPELFA